jgi:hypothetical protein
MNSLISLTVRFEKSLSQTLAFEQGDLVRVHFSIELGGNKEVLSLRLSQPGQQAIHLKIILTTQALQCLK